MTPPGGRPRLVRFLSWTDFYKQDGLTLEVTPVCSFEDTDRWRLGVAFSSETLDSQRFIPPSVTWHGCCTTRATKVGPARESGGMAYTGARSRFPAGPFDLRVLIPHIIFRVGTCRVPSAQPKLASVSSHKPSPKPPADTLGRPMRNLRLSVTDRCNLRCQYCMPEAEYVWLPRKDLLTFEEMGRLVEVFTELGVEKLRLTGGEPLLRKDLPVLVSLLKQNARIKDLAITTNGVQLAEQANALFEAGLDRVTVSLDTLRRERFQAINKRDYLGNVQEGIRAVKDAGFKSSKIDTVVIRGTNEDELADMIEYGKEVDAEVRFIEYMDVGGATKWSMEQVFSRAEILQSLEQCYGSVERLTEAQDPAAPAERFALSDGTIFGIISSTTQPFCQSCDRSRLTADGQWFLCLYSEQGIDLRGSLRGNASQEELRHIIVSAWSHRTDRGAEQRLGIAVRTPLVEVDGLRRNPHLEMHTRGG